MAVITDFLWGTRLRIIAFIAISATLIGYVAIVLCATNQGLDPRVLTGDSKGYVILAHNLLDHQVFSVDKEAPYAPESFRAPGYPMFLAVLFTLFGYSLFALLIHALIVGIAPVLLYLLFRKYHERAAFWSAIVFACEPVRIFLASSFLSDAFFTFMFLSSLVTLGHGRAVRSRIWIAVSGLLIGLAILIRPIAIFIPVVYALYLLICIRPMREAIMVAALVCGISLVIIFPWMYRNHSLFGSWNVSSVGTANLMLYNAPEFLKWHSYPDADHILEVFREEQALLPRKDALSLSRSEKFTSTFQNIIRGHEIPYVFFHITKTIPFFVTDGLRDTIRLFNVDIGAMPNLSTALMRGDVMILLNYLSAGGLPIILLFVGSGFWTLITVLFACEGVRSVIRRDIFPFFLLLLVCYFAFLTGPVSNARYRVPVEGLMLFLAITFIYRWYYARHVKT